MLLDNMKREISLWVAVTLVLITASQSSSDGYIWTAKGCNVTYETLEPIPVSFKTEPETYYQICILRLGFPEKCLYYGMGDGSVMSVSIVVGEPPGEVVFVLKMDCGGEYGGGGNDTGMYTKGECVVYLQESTISEDPSQSDYDPCRDVNCPITVCRGYDLWTQICVDGECVDFLLAEANSPQCGYDPCAGIECDNKCEELDLWSQTCVDGECVPLYLIEANSPQCGYDPCTNHCDNGRQDCGEYGVDCGGGCPFSDSDHDNVEDCIDLCLNSRCDRVDANGCEIDSDGDGVLDCDDGCVYDIGDISNQGCPDNNSFLFVGIGGAIALGGGLILWRRTGENPPGEDILEESCEEIGKQLEKAREAKEKAEANLNQKRNDVIKAEEEIKKLLNELEKAKNGVIKVREEIEKIENPDRSSWVEISGKPGSRIYTHDLRLRENAYQEAWNQYRARDITAQECMNKWEWIGTPEGLEKLRQEEIKSRPGRLEEARKREGEARDREQEAQGTLNKAKEKLDKAIEEEKAAKKELDEKKAEVDEWLQKYEKCKKETVDCIREFEKLKDELRDEYEEYNMKHLKCMKKIREQQDELSAINEEKLQKNWLKAYHTLDLEACLIKKSRKFVDAEIPEFDPLPLPPGTDILGHCPIPPDVMPLMGRLIGYLQHFLDPNDPLCEIIIKEKNKGNEAELKLIKDAWKDFDTVVRDAPDIAKNYLGNIGKLKRDVEPLLSQWSKCMEESKLEPLEVEAPRTLGDCRRKNQKIVQFKEKLKNMPKCEDCKPKELEKVFDLLKDTVDKVSSSTSKMESTRMGIFLYRQYVGYIK